MLPNVSDPLSGIHGDVHVDISSVFFDYSAVLRRPSLFDYLITSFLHLFSVKNMAYNQRKIDVSNIETHFNYRSLEGTINLLRRVCIDFWKNMGEMGDK
jgi:hypothetical protein